LTDLPGYDGESRCLRLTTDIEQTHDEEGRSVGYLGRAHPLVQRALERVRNIRFGSGDGLDRRVSAVRAPVKDPELLLTFLGRVMSGIGREFERVLAVRLGKRGVTQTYLAATEWLSFADRSKAIATPEIWEKHFAQWASPESAEVRDAARSAFAPLAEKFAREHRSSLEEERRRIAAWLKSRAEDILGGMEPAAVQLALDASTSSAPPSTRRQYGSPEERLAALSSDSSAAPSKRGEAETVLRLYRQRIQDLEARSALADPEIVPLGMLMLVPEGGRGA
jgi:hypothetical protein